MSLKKRTYREHEKPVASSGAAAPSDPSTFLTLSGWYKADALVGLSDGDPIETITDQSGNGLDYTQATESKRGVFKESIINGNPVWRTDGVNDVWDGGLLSTLITKTAFTMFGVAQHRNIVHTNPSVYVNHPYLVDRGGYFALALSDFTPDALTGWIYATASTLTPIPADNTAYYYIYRYDGTNMHVSINGGAETSTASGQVGSLAYLTSIHGMTVYGKYLDGDSLEMGFTKTDTTGANLTSLKAWLAYRAGV